MATYSITEVIARIRRLPEKVAERAVEVMKEEINSSTHGTGELAKTVKATPYADGSYGVGTHKYVGGGPYGIREVGAIIQAGRPELWPRYAKALHWRDSSGEHFAKYAGPAQPNNFVERTRDKIEMEIASGKLGLGGN